MAATVQATCPGCKNTLRIPAEWIGRPVKCKKCGAVVKSKPKGGGNGTQESAALPSAATAPAAPVPAAPRPAPPAPAAYPYPAPVDPATAAAYGAPPPGYAPPGYPPNGYAPPGYPPNGYAPPGYPPPGYAPPGYPQPYGYPQPQPNAFAGVEQDDAFAPSAATTGRSGGRYRRKPGGSKWVWMAFSLLMTGGLVAGALFGVKHIKKLIGAKEVVSTEPETQAAAPAATAPAAPPAVTGPFPRRLLFVHVGKYLYLNPLTSNQVDTNNPGRGGADQIDTYAKALAFEWRVPTDKTNNQLFVLSDTIAAANARTPLKGVLKGAYEEYFATSRPQDRILVYFGGHVLEKDDKAYLAPMDGDLDDPESLIPLDEFYGKMAASPAQQKVVIWDVCRFNPERGRARPGSEPMSEKLAELLAKTPEGVQAVTTCQAGENALEFYALDVPAGRQTVTGSSFLSGVKYQSYRTKAAVKTGTQADPLPVAEWAEAVAKRVEAAAAEAKLKQTVKAVGAAPAKAVAFDPAEPPAKRFELPQAPKGASAAEVAAITSEFTLPGLRPGPADTLDLPFRSDVLAEYKPDVANSDLTLDGKKYALRLAVLDAFKVIRDNWKPENLRDSFQGESSDAAKKRVLAEQEAPALIIADLELSLKKLEKAADLKAAEPKRWQANYEYALAQIKTRLAYMQEYNQLLGNIRTDNLPPLDPKKHDGYRLVSSPKMKSKKDVKEIAEAAQEHFAKLIEEHKGTPWAIQARRDKTLSLGLEWQLIAKPGVEDKDDGEVKKGEVAGKPAVVTFAQAQAVLRAHCVMCHGAPQIRAMIDVRTLESIGKKKGLVMPGDPGASDMWAAITSDSMPPPDKPRLTAGEKQIIKDWIASGAK